MKKKVLLNSLVAITLTTTAVSTIIVNASCSGETKPVEGVIDYKLQSHFNDWYKSLSTHPWNYDADGKLANYHCDSEQQAIFMYANQRGYYWNEALHQDKEPENRMVNLYFGGMDRKLETRGADYKYIVDALNKESTRWPYNYKVYHGVEYQEVEFYDQLKPYIKETNGDYDYSGCVGKTITSNGFISTSLDRIEALRYCDGSMWDTDDKILPLKEQVMFEINIPKDIIGAVYLGDFKFMGSMNTDNQVLINRYAKFKINKVYVDTNDRGEKVNVFDVDLISIGKPTTTN